MKRHVAATVVGAGVVLAATVCPAAGGGLSYVPLTALDPAYGGGILPPTSGLFRIERTIGVLATKLAARLTTCSVRAVAGEFRNGIGTETATLAACRAAADAAFDAGASALQAQGLVPDCLNAPIATRLGVHALVAASLSATFFCEGTPGGPGGASVPSSADVLRGESRIAGLLLVRQVAALERCFAAGIRKALTTVFPTDSFHTCLARANDRASDGIARLIARGIVPACLAGAAPGLSAGLQGVVAAFNDDVYCAF